MLLTLKQVYFPAILEGQQQPIIIQDSMGRDWRFCYRSWRNGRSRMYVLDGIKSYMDLMDWKAGDIGNVASKCNKSYESISFYF